ncbi:MAG TPA: transglutaminase family protein [Verrucomicrobiae bacterium]|jgi:transglutaminase-like putative cysteine protease|nr:transglutaminase family protein [Verrucomicrobiae bacterium]
MRYRIVHQTFYTYSSDVSVSHHVARLTPREGAEQRTFNHQLTMEPHASTLTTRVDYFGNETSHFTVNGVHRSLKVIATSEVEVTPRPAPSEGGSWEEARQALTAPACHADMDAQQFTYPSQHIPKLPGLAEYAQPSFAPGRSLLAAVVDLSGRIHRDFKFDTRATTIATPLEQVLKNRRGVCQDFAQLQIGGVRAMGLPARYVSGYLETLPPPGAERLVGADASHAWVQVYIPPNGWVNIDPTNDLIPSTRHIVLAWGRDYDDVSPIRGVIVGGGKHTLTVGVDVEPIA